MIKKIGIRQRPPTQFLTSPPSFYTGREKPPLRSARDNRGRRKRKPARLFSAARRRLRDFGLESPSSPEFYTEIFLYTSLSTYTYREKKLRYRYFNRAGRSQSSEDAARRFRQEFRDGISLRRFGDGLCRAGNSSVRRDGARYGNWERTGGVRSFFGGALGAGR